MMPNQSSTLTSTMTDDREQWRSRIQRALAELQSDIPGHDRTTDETAEGDATSER